jgi:type IX secretion system PorP/SprF family membrane protein
MFFISDNAGGGKLLTNDVGAVYSYKVKISKDFYFQPGLSAYYHSRTMQSNLTFSDMYFEGEVVGPTSEVLPEIKVQHADFAVSILGYLENYWLGANVDHLMSLSPILRSDLRYTNMKISVFGGAKYHIKRRLRNKSEEFIHVAMNYRYQSSLHQLELGGYYNRKPIIIGLWYRGIPFGNKYIAPDALIYLVGVKYNDFVFSYSYDMSIGKLISRTGGSHEVSVIYMIGSTKPLKKKYKPIPCPEF